MNLDLQFRACTLHVAGTELGEAVQGAKKERRCERSAINLQKITYDDGSVKKNG